MPLPKIVRLLAGTLAGAVLLVGNPTPASAATGFNLRTPLNGFGPGAAAARGSLSFPGTRTVSISSQVRDICPKDSYRAVLNMVADYTDGSSGTVMINQDANGCGADWVSGSKSVSFPKKVRRVYVVVFKYDADHHVTGENARSPWRDNPRT